MFPSHTCVIHERCHIAISDAGVNKNLSQSLQFCQEKGSKTTTSYSINLGMDSRQLKVKGAIILAQAAEARY